jgi:arginase
MNEKREVSPSLLPSGRRVEIIGVPLDLGQTERGTDVGPAAIRYAGLRERLVGQGHDVSDLGNLTVPAAAIVEQDQRVPTIARVTQELFEVTRASLSRGALPLVLGGDHSVAIGSVAASADSGDTGLLWIDAHGDFNTHETSPSGNVHGMPLAVVLGRGDPVLVGVGGNGARLRPEDVVIVGVRQLDPGERRALREAGVLVFSMSDIDERGMNDVADQALSVLSKRKNLHVSFDIDVMDPHDAPGVGTPVRGGLSYREMQLLMEKIADCERLSALDVVEVNPMLDVRNQTAQTAVDLILSALGQKIL